MNRPNWPKKRVYRNSNRVIYYFEGRARGACIIGVGRVGRTVLAELSPRIGHLAREMLGVFPDLKDVEITMLGTA